VKSQITTRSASDHFSLIGPILGGGQERAHQSGLCDAKCAEK
jgi:hypothetical protein